MQRRYKLLHSELKARQQHSLYRSLEARPSAPNFDFSSNDYLGLAHNPQLAEATHAYLRRNARSGAGAARLLSANLPVHLELEQATARFKACEAALLFSSGYLANLGTIAALAGPSDAVYSDQLNHASLIDGCRLSRARVHVYRHLDLDDLARHLAAGATYRRRLIVSESLFGMDGDIADLVGLERLAQRYDALLIVDEAHATGIYGPSGSGLVAKQQASVDLQICTFGKALGTSGAAVVGPRLLIDYLINHARPFLYTTAPPPTVCAATLSALRWCASGEGDKARGNLRNNIALFRRQLLVPPAQLTPTPIQPLLLADAEAALSSAQALQAAGYFVKAIRPPTVPRGTSRLRISLSAAHQPDTLVKLARKLSELLPQPSRTPAVGGSLDSTASA